MKLMKKFFIAIVLLMIAFVAVSCKKNEETTSYTYPETTPMVSTKDETFVEAYGQKATNADAYVYLKYNYGLETALRWLANQVCVEGSGFTDYLNKAKENEDFYDDCKDNGLETEEEIEAYYHLLYSQYCYGEEVVRNAQTKVDALAAILAEIKLPGFVAEDFTLVTEQDGNEITWSSNSSYVVIDEEKATVTRGHYDVDVTLTASITDEEFTTTATYEFVVPATSHTDFEVGEATVKANGFFTEDEIEAYYEENYHDTIKALVFTFKSYNEALAVMPQNPVGSNDQRVFGHGDLTTIICDYSKNPSDYMFERTYEEWAEFNSTVATTLYAMELGETTQLPVSAGSFVFLASIENIVDKPELSAVRSEIIEALLQEEIESDHSTDVMEKVMTGKVEVFDEGLEATFEDYILGVFADDTDFEYERTTNTSSSVVVRYTKEDGTVCELTADKLFADMAALYGNKLAYAYISKFAVLAASEIVDPVTQKPLEGQQDYYDEICDEEVTELKEALEAGSYADLGFASTYGFENYLRDAKGYNSVWDLLTDSVSTIYSEALTSYKKVATDGKHEDIYNKAKSTIDSYFNITVAQLSFNFDFDGNGVADTVFGSIDVEDADDKKVQFMDDFTAFWNNEQADLTAKGYTMQDLNEQWIAAHNAVDCGASLVNLFYYFLQRQNTAIEDISMTGSDDFQNTCKAIFEVVLKETTTATKLAKYVELYNMAKVTDAVFGDAKKKGVVLSYSSNITYNQDSSLEGDQLDALKEMYVTLKGLKDTVGFDIIGMTVENGYVTKNDKVVAVDAIKMSDIKVGDKYVCYFAVSTKAQTLFKDSYDKTLGVLTEFNYNEYLKTVDDDDDTEGDITSAVKNMITTYYVPAVNALQAEYYEQLPATILAAINDSTITVNSLVKDATISYVTGLTEEE